MDHLLDTKIGKDTLIVSQQGNGFLTEDYLLPEEADTENNQLTVSTEINNDNTFKLNYITDVLYVIPPNMEESKKIRQIAIELLKYFTFRRIGRILKKNSTYDGEEFYYGFTDTNDLYHAEFYDYPLAYNSSRIFGLPAALYYQCGDYVNPLFKEGLLQLEETTYNHKKPGNVGDLMCGLAIHGEQSPRYIKWFYCSKAFYLLWILIQFGENWYIFRGLNRQRILDKLYDPSEENPHLYQAYALVIYFNEPIPDEYNLHGFDEIIKNNLLNVIA